MRTPARLTQIFFLPLAMTLVTGVAEAKRYYYAKKHNSNFMSGCTVTHPSVYNPNISNKMEGGGKNRHSEKINSIEDAAKNGRPVTVAMDYRGSFGSKCNRSASRCLMLVHVPGIDKKFPAYSRRFQNLPKDSILAIVEDTGGAFYNKGTGKIDIAIRSGGYHNKGVGSQASFEILDQVGKAGRMKDYSYFKPFIQGREAKCSGEPNRDRQPGGIPLAEAEPEENEIAPVAERIPASEEELEEPPVYRPKPKRAYKKAKTYSYRPKKSRVARPDLTAGEILMQQFLGHQ